MALVPFQSSSGKLFAVKCIMISIFYKSSIYHLVANLHIDLFSGTQFFAPPSHHQLLAQYDFGLNSANQNIISFMCDFAYS